MIDVASVCCLLSFGLLLSQPIPSHHPSYGRCCCLLFAVVWLVIVPAHPIPPPSYSGWVDVVSAVCCCLACYCPSPAHPITLLWSMLLVSAVCCRLFCYCPSPSHPTTPSMVDVASLCCFLSFVLSHLLWSMLLVSAVCCPFPSHHPPMVDVASVCCLLLFGLLLSQPILSHHPFYGRCC